MLVADCPNCVRLFKGPSHTLLVEASAFESGSAQRSEISIGTSPVNGQVDVMQFAGIPSSTTSGRALAAQGRCRIWVFQLSRSTISQHQTRQVRCMASKSAAQLFHDRTWGPGWTCQRQSHSPSYVGVCVRTSSRKKVNAPVQHGRETSRREHAPSKSERMVSLPYAFSELFFLVSNSEILSFVY